MSVPIERTLSQTSVHLINEHAVDALGDRLAACLKPGTCVTLSGDLGVGKTRLARSVIHALVGSPCPVPSPTFTLVQLYDTPQGRVWHFDLYRLAHAEELAELGWDDALSDITLVEWPERASEYVPAVRVDVQLAFGTSAEERHVTLTADPDWLVQFNANCEADQA